MRRKNKILITSPRAPIVIEWIQIMQKSGHEVALVDTLDYPIARFYGNTTYIKIPAPRLEFDAYKAQIGTLLDEYDLIIPTCEDIFYLSLATTRDPRRKKIFMPDNELLFGLHNKFTFGKYMNAHVRVPETRYCTEKTMVRVDAETILKPVFSRFGRSIIRKVDKENIDRIEISSTYPWVQQKFIKGESLCNYAILDKGKVVTHAVYRPRYLLNNSASTYFEYVRDERCEKFIRQFGIDTQYHGQVAFDFIDDGKDLYVLECNPRATSGLHLIAASVRYHDGKFKKIDDGFEAYCGIGKNLFLLFGLEALWSGKLGGLYRDYNKAKDVFAGIPMHAQLLSLYEMIKRAFIYKMPFTSASTFDIEYDG